MQTKTADLKVGDVVTFFPWGAESYEVEVASAPVESETVLFHLEWTGSNGRRYSALASDTFTTR